MGFCIPSASPSTEGNDCVPRGKHGNFDHFLRYHTSRPICIVNCHKMQGGRRNTGNRTLQGSRFPFKLRDTSEPLRCSFCSALVVTDRQHSSPTEQSLIFRCPFQSSCPRSEWGSTAFSSGIQRQRIRVICQTRKCKRTFIWKMKKTFRKKMLNFSMQLAIQLSAPLTKGAAQLEFWPNLSNKSATI